MSGSSRVERAAVLAARPTIHPLPPAPEPASVSTTDTGPWIATVPYAAAVGPLREAYDWQAARLGAPTEFTLLGSLHPPLVLERLRLYKTVDEVPSALTALEKALAAFITSTLNETAYCASGARLKVLAAGLREDRLRTLERELARALAWFREEPARQRPPRLSLPRLDARLRAIVRYALVLTLRPGAVQKRDVTWLRLRGLGDLEILDLNDIVAYYSYVNRVANGLGLRHPIADPAEAFHARPA